MASGIAEAPPAGLGKILMESRFAVPNHQRDYSWTEDEVRQMFDDVEAAQSAGDETYFIGLMVFMESEATLIRPSFPLEVLPEGTPPGQWRARPARRRRRRAGTPRGPCRQKCQPDARRRSSAMAEALEIMV